MGRALVHAAHGGAALGWRLDWVESFPLHQGATVFTELMNGRTNPVKALLCPERSEV